MSQNFSPVDLRPLVRGCGNPFKYIKTVWDTGTHQLTRNLLGKEETNSRSHPRILRTNRVMRQGHNGEGIIFNTGASWQEQRKFLNNTLRDLAKGDSRMEDLINKEVDLFCESAGDTLAAQINTEGVR